MGFAIFVLLVIAAFLVSPWFLLAAFVIVALSGWAATGRRY